MTTTPTGKETGAATTDTNGGDPANREGLENPQKPLGDDTGVNVANLQLSQDECGIAFGDRNPHGKGTLKFLVYESPNSKDHW